MACFWHIARQKNNTCNVTALVYYHFAFIGSCTGYFPGLVRLSWLLDAFLGQFLLHGYKIHTIATMPSSAKTDKGPFVAFV